MKWTKQETDCVSKSFVCVHAHTHTCVQSGSLAGPRCPTPLWWVGAAQPGETRCSPRSGSVSASGQWLGSDLGSLLIHSARHPCSSVSPSFYSWRGVCGHQSSQSMVILHCTFPAVSGVSLLSLVGPGPLPRLIPLSSCLRCPVCHD